MSDNVVKVFLKNTHNNNLLDELKRQKILHEHYSTRSKLQDEFNRAKSQIKRQIISADNSMDNSVIYTAINQFKEKNE